MAGCKEWESAVSDPFGETLIFFPKVSSGRLFSKIIFENFSDFVYFWNKRKTKNAVKLLPKCGFTLDQISIGRSYSKVTKLNHLTPKNKQCFKAIILLHNQCFNILQYESTMIFQAISKTPLETVSNSGKR